MHNRRNTNFIHENSEKEVKSNSFHRPPSNFKKSSSDKGDLKNFDPNHYKSNSFTHHFTAGNEIIDINLINKMNNDCINLSNNLKTEDKNVDFGTAKFEFKGQKVDFIDF